MTGSGDAAIDRPHDEVGSADDAEFELTLFVSGASDLSARAIANAELFCESYLGGRYRLSVVDLYEDPAALRRSGILATPTLMKEKPLPIRRFVGDLSHTDRVLRSLGFPSGAAPAALA